MYTEPVVYESKVCQKDDVIYLPEGMKTVKQIVGKKSSSCVEAVVEFVDGTELALNKLIDLKNQKAVSILRPRVVYDQIFPVK